MRDLKIGDKVIVAVPTPYDPALDGQQLLRKPGGLRGKRMETLAEVRDGLLLGKPHDIPRTDLSGYFTSKPEEAVVTPWLLQMLAKRSLIMIDAPSGDIRALDDEEESR